jgi:hypothetical protein
VNDERRVLDGGWRWQAARVVEELFPVTEAGVWDDLLELRRLLLGGGDWVPVLDHFLVCRERLERDHYLPFYRLRRLLEGHLRLVARTGRAAGGQTVELALWRHRRMDDLRRRAQRDHWESVVAAVGAPGGVEVEVVERPG